MTKVAIAIRTTGIEDYLDGGTARVKALILGRPGVGKTRSASFWPKPIFLDADKGRMSIADRKMPYAEVKDSGDVIDFLDHLRRDAVQGSKRKYETVVIDTFDSLQRTIIAERLRQTGNAGLSGWEDWGWLDAKMQAIMERLLNLDMNVIVNVHLQSKQEGDDGPIIYEPKLKGDIRNSIPGDFDLVGHMGTFWEAVEGERVMKRAIWWSPQPGFEILKDRSGSFPKMTPVVFDESDYANLFEPLRARASDLTAGEAYDEVPQAEAAAPAPADLTGGPVEPTKTSVAAPAAKKAAAAPAAPKAEPAPKAAAKPMEVVEEGSGTEAAPAPEATPEPAAEATTPVVAEPTQEPTHEEAVATVTETLGGTVVSDTEAADVPSEPEQPAPAGDEPPLICGSPGPLKNGTANPAPVDGCGGNIREIATTEEARNTVNVAFMRTRTFLCPPCFAAYQAASA